MLCLYEVSSVWLEQSTAGVRRVYSALVFTAVVGKYLRTVSLNGPCRVHVSCQPLSIETQCCCAVKFWQVKWPRFPTEDFKVAANQYAEIYRKQLHQIQAVLS